MRHGRGDYNQEGMYKPRVGEDWGGNENSYDTPIRRPSQPESGSSSMMRSGGHHAQRIEENWGGAQTNL